MTDFVLIARPLAGEVRTDLANASDVERLSLTKTSMGPPPAAV